MSDIAQPGAVAAVDWQQDSQGQKRKPKGEVAKRAMASYAASDRVITDEVTILGIPASDMSPQMQAAVADLLSEVQSLRAQLGLPVSTASIMPPSAVRHGHALIEATEPVVAKGVPDQRHMGVVVIDVANFDDLRGEHGTVVAIEAMEDLAERIYQNAPVRLEPIGVLSGGVMAGLTIREADDTNWSGPEAALDVWLSDQSIGPESYAGPLTTRTRIDELRDGETFGQVIDRLQK